MELADIKADPSAPGSGSAFGNSEQLVWKEEEIPSSDGKTEAIRDYFYEAYRNNKPYPITSAQAIEVVRTIEAAKKARSLQNNSTVSGENYKCVLLQDIAEIDLPLPFYWK